MAGLLIITAPGNKLTEVGISGCSGLGDEGVLAVAQSCPHMMVFYSPPQVWSEAVVALAQGCPLLKEVSIALTRADDSAVAALCLHCPLLRSLVLWGCEHVANTFVATLRKQYPSLNIYM